MQMQGHQTKHIEKLKLKTLKPKHIKRLIFYFLFQISNQVGGRVAKCVNRTTTTSTTTPTTTPTTTIFNFDELFKTPPSTRRPITRKFF